MRFFSATALLMTASGLLSVPVRADELAEAKVHASAAIQALTSAQEHLKDAKRWHAEEKGAGEVLAKKCPIFEEALKKAGTGFSSRLQMPAEKLHHYDSLHDELIMCRSEALTARESERYRAKEVEAAEAKVAAAADSAHEALSIEEELEATAAHSH